MVGYPRIFNGEDCNAGTWFSPAEETRLNADRRPAQQQARRAPPSAKGFAFANPTSRFVGHAVCDDVEWLNGLSNPISESYHPNRTGHSSGYTPLVSPLLTGATLTVSAATLRAAAAPGDALAAQQRTYAAADAAITPGVVHGPRPDHAGGPGRGPPGRHRPRPLAGPALSRGRSVGAGRSEPMGELLAAPTDRRLLGGLVAGALLVGSGAACDAVEQVSGPDPQDAAGALATALASGTFTDVGFTPSRPPALNLLETRDGARRGRRARVRRRRRRRARGRRHRAARRGQSTLLSALLREWRSRGASVAVLAVDPSSKRSGGAFLGDRARIEHAPADRDVFIRSMAACERLGGLAPADPRRGAGPGQRVRRRRHRDGRGRPVRDRRGRGRGHRHRGRSARLRRRPPVPEGRDHGSAGRAGDRQGRPRHRRPGAPRRTSASPSAPSAPAPPRCWPCRPSPRRPGSASWPTRWPRTAPRSISRLTACGCDGWRARRLRPRVRRGGVAGGWRSPRRAAGFGGAGPGAREPALSGVP